MNRFNGIDKYASYSCIECSCNGRGSLKLTINEDDPNLILETFIIKKPHNIPRNEHNYIRDINIKKDYVENNIELIKEKLTNYIYLKKFLIEYIIDAKNKGYNIKQIKVKFELIYGKIILNYDNIPKDYKNKILNYKKCKNNINIKLKTFII